MCSSDLRSLVLLSAAAVGAVESAEASVLSNLASALLPQHHVVYQHLAESKAFTHLADLKPTSTSVGWGSFLVDRSWYGKGFEIGGEQFTSGVFAHAPSALKYNLGSRYSVFTGCAGPDSRKACGDGVQFHIVADGKTVWSADRKPGDKAACFSVNVQNVNTLELHADHKSNTECDHAEWVNGKIYEDPAIDCRRLAALVPASQSVGWSPSVAKPQWTKDGFRVGGSPSKYRCDGQSGQYVSDEGPPLPVCIANPCTFSLPDGLGVSHDCDGVTTDGTCTATCGPGYGYAPGEQEEQFTCTWTGEFSGTSPV